MCVCVCVCVCVWVCVCGVCVVCVCVCVCVCRYVSLARSLARSIARSLARSLARSSLARSSLSRSLLARSRSLAPPSLLSACSLSFARVPPSWLFSVLFPSPPVFGRAPALLPPCSGFPPLPASSLCPFLSVCFSDIATKNGLSFQTFAYQYIN